MRLKIDIKPKEATFQVVLDALALTLFYRAFLITIDVLAIYMQEFWATISVHSRFLSDSTNQAMLESKAYQTYYAFASEEKDPKSKYIQKKGDSDTSPKKKPVTPPKMCRSGKYVRERYFIIQQHKIQENHL
ncbi:hypothetical protein Tco_1171828 [Tanacetum coccineum]